MERKSLSRKTKSSVKASSISSFEDNFTYFCQPLENVIPPGSTIPIFIESCITYLESLENGNSQ